MGKLEKIQVWQLTKVRNKKRSHRWSKERRQNRALHVINGHLSSQELGVGTKISKNYNGGVVLWGDIAKFDSGSYAEFTEQGSSASQMTAAEVMDIKSRLPGCAGQAADAVYAETQIRMDDAPSLLKIPKSECPDIGIRHQKTQLAKIMIQYGRSCCSAWTKSVWSSFGRTVLGKAIWENPFEVRLGEGFQLIMLFRTPWKRVILVCVCGWHQIGWKETEH